MNPEQPKNMKKLFIWNITICKYQNPLDYPITENELIDKIQALKNKKASGPDDILNEMLKTQSTN